MFVHITAFKQHNSQIAIYRTSEWVWNGKYPRFYEVVIILYDRMKMKIDKIMNAD